MTQAFSVRTLAFWIQVGLTRPHKPCHSQEVDTKCCWSNWPGRSRWSGRWLERYFKPEFRNRASSISCANFNAVMGSACDGRFNFGEIGIRPARVRPSNGMLAFNTRRRPARPRMAPEMKGCVRIVVDWHSSRALRHGSQGAYTLGLASTPTFSSTAGSAAATAVARRGSRRVVK